jgi:AcrR family transcriptional regulator
MDEGRPMASHKKRTHKSPDESAVRQRIIAAARLHFLTHGFRGVTMDDLAGELGMSKKTLYAYFPSKSALLEAVLHDKFTSLEADVARVTAERASDFAVGLQRLLACIQRHTDEVRSPFVRDIQREAPELFHMVEGRRREVIRRHFGKVLAQGRREKLIRKDIPLRLIIEVLLGATQAVINPPMMEELGLTPTTGFTAIISVILQGVITEKGRSNP